MQQYKVYYNLLGADNKTKAKSTIHDPAKKPADAILLEFEAENDVEAQAKIETMLPEEAKPARGLTNVKKSRGSIKPPKAIPVLIDLNTINEPLKTKLSEVLTLVDEGLTVENNVYRVSSLELINKPVKVRKTKVKTEADDNVTKLKITIPGVNDTPVTAPVEAVA